MLVSELLNTNSKSEKTFVGFGDKIRTELQTSIDSGTISIPQGLTKQERRELIRKSAQEIN